MKTLILGFTAVAVGWAMPALAEDYVIDPSHAFIGYEINHLGFSTNIGRFKAFDGKISADWDHPEDSSLEVTVQTASIDSDWEKRDEHLRSADFFDVENYPTMTFVSREITVTGEDEAEVTGDLTIRDQTHPVTLDVFLIKRGPHPFNPKAEVVGISATGTLKRSEWGITTYLPLVGDEVSLRIEAELNRAVAE